MIKFTTILTIGVLICTYILPWYFIIPIGIVAGIFSDKKPWTTFLLGLLLASGIWILISTITDSFYLKPVSAMLSSLFGNVAPVYLYIATGLIMGIAVAFSALSGNFLRPLFVKNKRLI